MPHIPFFQRDYYKLFRSCWKPFFIRESNSCSFPLIRRIYAQFLYGSHEKKAFCLMRSPRFISSFPYYLHGFYCTLFFCPFLSCWSLSFYICSIKAIAPSRSSLEHSLYQFSHSSVFSDKSEVFNVLSWNFNSSDSSEIGGSEGFLTKYQ